MIVDAHSLSLFNRAVPRYTSYPTAPEWETLTEETYARHLCRLGSSCRPISLYIHVPFCRTMCLYCACSVVLNRRPEKEERYVEYVLQEAALIGQYLKQNSVKQLHIGGGTPTQLSPTLLERLIKGLHQTFSIDPTGELSIEIDPRTVVDDDGQKLRLLRQLGFNRVSFGVQDTDDAVQEAIRRRQSFAVTKRTYELARQIEFHGVNVDLIYGLPRQTPSSFERTVQDILSLRPDRIALYSYARVPWLKPHQNAIPEEALPTVEEKFSIYVHAREQFLAAGYVSIGMDHFALPHDPLSLALSNGQLQRNFQGYSLKLAEDLVGLGISSTGLVDGCYAQNHKTMEAYYAALDAQTIPVFRGKVLTLDDQIRKWTIHSMMCDFKLDTSDFEKRFGVSFDFYFAHELHKIHTLVSEGLLDRVGKDLVPTPAGSLFIRNVASVFDAYLGKTRREGRFAAGV